MHIRGVQFVYFFLAYSRCSEISGEDFERLRFMGNSSGNRVEGQEVAAVAFHQVFSNFQQ